MEPIVAELGHAVIDADNHYYEALDAFTRHLDVDRDLAQRCVQWATIDGRQHHVVGGRVARAVTNPTFDPIAKPGCLYDYFRGNAPGANPIEAMRDSEPIRPEYRDVDSRRRTLVDQGLAGCWMFPTLGMVYEALLAHDPEANCATFRAFNRWLADDWPLDDPQIVSAPYLTLADVAWACDELEWALDAGARLVVMRTAAPVTATGRRSPFDEANDPFWARVNEAGITVVVHAGDSSVSAEGYAPDGFAATFGGGWKPSIKMFAIERAVHDWFLHAMGDNLFQRFPNLRIASVENGAEFLPELFRRLRSIDHKAPGWFGGDPVEVFRRHVWINPFWEDDLDAVIGHMGADRVLFGSDWPHIEALPHPLDELAASKHLDPADRRAYLLDNVTALSTSSARHPGEQAIR